MEDTQLTGITGNGMILVERKIDAVPAPLQCLSLSNLAFSSRMMTPTASRSDSNCFVSCPLMNTTVRELVQSALNTGRVRDETSITLGELTLLESTALSEPLSGTISKLLPPKPD